MAEPLVSVIVPTAGPSARLARCLAAVRAQGLPVELLKVRGASFAAAVNAGMRAARAPNLLWLNDDAVLGPGALTRMQAALRRVPRAGAVGPCTNDPASGSGLGRALPLTPAALPRLSAAWALKHHGRTRAVDRLTGFCLLTTRAVVARVGNLDERFRWGEEDDDWCFRARQAGCGLVLALDALVYHEGGATRRLMPARRRAALAAANRRLLRLKWLVEGGRIARAVRAETR